MDVVSPLSLLEVTMSEECNADDDCIVIEDDDDDVETPVKSEPKPCKIAKMEVEVDPLSVSPSVCYTNKQDDMPTLWVSTNINNLAGVAHTETEFRKSQYSNVYEVLTEILHCTICLDHVGCDIRIHPSSIEHPVLRVLICEHCVCMYKTVNFIMNDKGKEINCRWCGKMSSAKGPVIRTCQQCPFSFCEICLQKNCPGYFESEPRVPWTCIVCNIQVLWPARATLWALHCLKSLLLSNPGNSLTQINGDISLCCKHRKKKKKKVVDALQTLEASEPGLVIDQLVPPHLLNGSTEVDFYRTHLPEIDFPIEYYNNSIKPNVKPRAKPRPRPRPKPKPKPKTNASCSSSVSAPPVVKPVEPDHKTPIRAPPDNKKPHWLRQKLNGYINDFEQLRKKLEDIEKSLDFDENDAQTEEKVDNVTTLLSLHRELLNSCRLSLINEWKERKARLVLNNYNHNAEEGFEKSNITPRPMVILEKVPTKKGTKINSKKNNMVNINNIEYANTDKNTTYPIKECYVKLKRLDIPLGFPIKQDKKKVK